MRSNGLKWFLPDDIDAISAHLRLLDRSGKGGFVYPVPRCPVCRKPTTLRFRSVNGKPRWADLPCGCSPEKVATIFDDEATQYLSEALVASADGEPIITNLGDVEPENVQWLWPRRFARGKLHLLMGDPGGGSRTSCVISPHT